tara:strand:- start:1900 stop:2343 length:444 start_codon:yes stop_codon:yes gene_type:complete
MNLIPDNKYKYILENMPIACVDLIIKNEKGEVLMIKRTNPPAKDMWWFPGGRILKKETIEQAAIRQAKEEINLTVTFEKIVGVYETIFDTGPLDIQTGTHSINIVVKVTPKDLNKISLDSHHTDFRFISKVEEDWNGYLTQAITDSK